MSDETTTKKGKSGLAISGFVLAIIGLVFAFIPFLNVVAIVVSAIGLILAFIAIFTTGKKSAKSGRGLAIVGAILAVIGLIAGIVTTVSYTKVADDAAKETISQIQKGIVNDKAKKVEIEATASGSGNAGVVIDTSSASHDFKKTYTQTITGEDAKKLITVTVTGDWEKSGDQTVGCTVKVDGKQVAHKTATGQNPSATCSSLDATK